MARISELPELTALDGADEIVVTDSGTSDLTTRASVDTLVTYLEANLDLGTTIDGINDVPGLQTALTALEDGKANVDHTHIIDQVLGLRDELDTKYDSSTAGILGNTVIIGSNSININDVVNERVADITGVSPTDARIPGNVTIGNRLVFTSTNGQIGEETPQQFKADLLLNNVDNTADVDKPISSATQSALDLKLGIDAFTEGQASQDALIAVNTAKNGITDEQSAAIVANTAKITYPTSDMNKLAGIEAGADITDTANVWSSLGVSTSGSTTKYLTERGVFTAAEADLTLDEIGGKALPTTAPGDQQGFRFSASSDEWEYTTIPTLPSAPGATSDDTNYELQVQDDGTQAWVESSGEVGGIFDRNRQVVDVDFGGTRSNIVSGGSNEISRIFLRDDFNSGSTLGTPIQFELTDASTYTGINSSPINIIQFRSDSIDQFSTNQSFNVPVESQYTIQTGDTYLHVFEQVFSMLDGVSATVGGEDITFGWDAASNVASIFGLSVESSFAGSSDVLLQLLRDGSSFPIIYFRGNNTTTYNIGDPDTTVSSYSYDPDIADTVYGHTVDGNFSNNANTTTALTELGTAIAASHSDITWDGNVVTGASISGNPASYINVNLGTSNNIDSSFTITANGGTNVDEMITNFDAVTGAGLHSTYTVVDYSGTQITSFTSSVDSAGDSDLDQVAQIIANSINNNVETPIDFTSVYNAATNELVLTSEAGWTASTAWSITADHGAITVAGLVPNGANLTTATTFDTGGGGAASGQWYWREAQGTNTVVEPAEWSDLQAGNQIIIDTPALDDATTEALQAAVDISDSLFVRTDTGSAEIEISGTSGTSSNDYRFTIASIIRSYGTPGFSGGISLSDTASEETDATAKGDISIVVNPGVLEQINEISRIQIDESITFSDATEQTTAFDPTSFPSGTAIVTTDTDQTITGSKTFNSTVSFPGVDITPASVDTDTTERTSISNQSLGSGAYVVNFSLEDSALISDFINGREIDRVVFDFDGQSISASNSSVFPVTFTVFGTFGQILFTSFSSVTSSTNVTLTSISVDQPGSLLTNVGVTFGDISGNVTSKTLDDYEEGTWTPIANGLVNTDSSTDFSLSNGTYTKVGNLVTANAAITIPANADSSQAGFTLGSLPFEPRRLFSSSGEAEVIGVWRNTTVGFAPTGLVLDYRSLSLIGLYLDEADAFSNLSGLDISISLTYQTS